jgi:hypothetical protein
MMETGPVSKMSCFYSLEYRMMEKVQEPSNSECYTPSSEPFRIYYFENLSAPENAAKKVFVSFSASRIYEYYG